MEAHEAEDERPKATSTYVCDDFLGVSVDCEKSSGVSQTQGEGVVGEFPTLEPGESFEYTSGTPLKTTNGIMQGFYLMSQNNGEQLKIDIPAFSLDSPYNKKNLH